MRLTAADRAWMRLICDGQGVLTGDLAGTENISEARKKLLRKEHERRVMKNLDRLDRRDARRKRLERHLMRLAIKIDREEQTKMRQPTHGPGSEGAAVVVAHAKEKLVLAELRKWLAIVGNERPNDPLAQAGRDWLRAEAEVNEARKRAGLTPIR